MRRMLACKHVALTLPNAVWDFLMIPRARKLADRLLELPFTDVISLARSAARVPAIMSSRLSTLGADISFNIDPDAADKFKPDQNLPTHNVAT
jgi:hypothetical protein